MTASPLAAAAASITLDGVFRRAFDIFADRIALTSEDGAWTYAQVRDRAWRARTRWPGLVLLVAVELQC
jgi:hypothetical protein